MISKETNKISIHIYTIGDLQRWIDNGEDIGIDNNVLSNARSVALLNNPYSKSTTPAIAVAFDAEKPVGYTAVFPDKLDGKTIYFGTTGFIDASMRGMGVGTRLYAAMMEATGNNWFATDSAPAALAISKKTGLNIQYYNRTYLLLKSNAKSLKGKLAESIVNHSNKRVLKNIYTKTKLQIVKHIDENTYHFIVAHNGDGLFLRERAMLNWVLQYPFKSVAPQDLSSYSDYLFTTAQEQYAIYAFKIMMEGRLIGFAMFRLSNNILTLLYFYYDEKYSKEVYDALLLHILKQDIAEFRTFDAGLIAHFNLAGGKSLNKRTRSHEVSLSFPRNITLNPSKNLHCGDGDMFC